MNKYRIEFRASRDQGISWYLETKIIEAYTIDDAIRYSGIYYKLITNAERI
jgi:hypothetical protein